VVLVLSAAAIAPLTAAALDIIADSSITAPVLPAAAAPGTGDRRVLPPAPPPALRGSVVPVPDPLQSLFAGGGSAGRLLEQLLREAVANLGTSAALAAAQPAGSQLDQQQWQQIQLPLVVSPDLDFGTLAVSTITAGELITAAASAAEGLPQHHGAGSMAHVGAGSLLDLLHLSAAAQQPQQQGATHADAALPVLHFRQLLVENCSSSDEVWLLGGVAAPSFPHTLAACDDAHLFWRDGKQAALVVAPLCSTPQRTRLQLHDCPRRLKLQHHVLLPSIDCAGHKAVRLGPKQQHTISVALSSADCAARRQEKGILQQLLLLVFAVAPHTHTAAVLAQVEGAAVADFPPPEGATAAALEEGGSAAPAIAAAAGVPAAAAPFRLFVVARRVTAALVDRPADLASLLDAEAKPFIAARLRQLFDSPPTAKVRLFPPAARQLLSGAALPTSAVAAAILPAHYERGQAAQHSWQLPAIPDSPAAPLLRRYSRLLVLEESAMEVDIRRQACLLRQRAMLALLSVRLLVLIALLWFHCCGSADCPMAPPLRSGTIFSMCG
jgi:hypothetical protein